MRLYLSSWRLGSDPAALLGLLRDAGPARVAVVGNALDAAAPDVRRDGVAREVAALGGLGLRARELDLRDHVGTPDRLEEALDGVAMVWLRGGNVFVLRHALALSGADTVLAARVRAGSLVWAGYSAGACVLAPSLRGLELIDDPAAVRESWRAGPRWSGLGLLPYAIVPHYRSDHPESAAAGAAAAHYRAHGVPHRTLRDGEAVVVDD